VRADAANNGWTNSGLVVRKGQRLRISASGRVSLGRGFRARRLFLIPEESYPPRVLRRLRRFFRHAPRDAGFVDAVVDPRHNAIACAADVARTQHSDALRHVHDALVARALIDGPDALADAERNALLGDALALSRLHSMSLYGSLRFDLCYNDNLSTTRSGGV